MEIPDGRWVDKASLIVGVVNPTLDEERAHRAVPNEWASFELLP